MAYDGSLKFDTKIDSKGFTTGLSKLGSLGLKATAAVGAGLTALGGYALKMSIDFESAFAGVKKTVNGTTAQLDALRAGILQMSEELPASATEISGVAEAAGQLGIKTDNILDFTRVMVDLGESTNLSAEQAATSLARLANIMQTPQTQFSNLGSTIVALGNNLATTESEIVEMGLRIAGTGKQVGLAESQVLSLAGAMSSMGINAEAGGSSISRVMQKVNTEVLSGGSKLQAFASIAGQSAEEFANTWKSDPQTALVSFVAGLGRVKEQGGSVASTLKELGIHSIMEVDTLSRLSGNVDVLTEAFELGNTAYKQNNALTTEAAQRYETTASKIEILKNNANALAIAVGDRLSGSFTKLLDLGISSTQQLSTAFEQSGLSGIANQIAKNADDIVEGAGAFVSGFIEKLTVNIPKLADAGLGMITALGKSLVDHLPEFIETAPRLINDLAGAIYGQIPKILKCAWDLMSALAVGLVKAIPVIIKNLPQIIMAIVNVITLFNWASAGKSIIQGLGNGMKSLTGWLKANAGNIIKSVGEGFLTIIKSLPSIARSIISALVNGLSGGSGSVLRAVTNIGSKMLQSLLSLIPKFLGVGKDIVRGIAKGIINSAGLVVDCMKNLASKALGSITGFLKIKSPSRVMRDKVGKPIVQGIVVGIDKESKSLTDKMEDISEKALEKAKEKAGNYKEVGELYSKELSNGLDKSANLSIDAVKRLIDGAVPSKTKENKQAVADYKKAGKEVASAYAEAIKSGIAKAKEEIAQEVQRITEEAQNQYDAILAKQQEMEQKLGGFGDLFVIDNETKELTVGNINEQIDAIKRYDNALTELKNKGVGDDFLAEVTKLGVSEGTKFAEALLKMSDNQFKQYQNNWAEKQKLAKEVAMKFYKDQLDAIQDGFVQKIDATMKTVPATVKNIGINSIEGMIAGMDARKDGAVSKAREIADAVIEEMQRAMDIHSPSRVMRDLIGKNIVKGIEVGIEDEQKSLVSRMRGAVEGAKAEMSTIVGTKSGTRASVVTNNNDNGVNQVVNFYQPVKSPVENAREMKRAAKELAYGY